MILDLYRILFHAVVIFGLEHDFLFKSTSTYCAKVLQNFSLTWFVDVLFGDACKAQQHWHIIYHIWYKFLNWDPGEHFDHVLFCQYDVCKFSHRAHKHFHAFFGVPCNSVSRVMEFRLWGVLKSKIFGQKWTYYYKEIVVFCDAKSTKIGHNFRK